MRIIIKVLIFFLLIIPIQLHAKEFLDSFLHINFGGAYSFPKGEVIDYEHNTYYQVTTTGQYVRPTHYATSFGVTLDFTPFSPLILGNESNAIKFGIRGSYKLHYIQQTITFQPYGKKEYKFSGYLVNYQAMMGGPVIHYAPFIKASDLTGDYTAAGGLTFYALYGQLNHGNISSIPARRAAIQNAAQLALSYGLKTQAEINDMLREYYTGLGIYKTKIKGYKIDLGIGGEISLCAINLGVNFYYSQINFNMKYPVYTYYNTTGLPIYTLGKKSRINEFSIEVYMGIPLQWSKFPKIF